MNVPLRVSFPSPRRRSQVVRQRSAKPRYGGSNPPGASQPPSTFARSLSCAWPALRPPSWSWRAWACSHLRPRPRSASVSGIPPRSAGTGRSTTVRVGVARAWATGAWPSGWRGTRASPAPSVQRRPFGGLVRPGPQRSRARRVRHGRGLQARANTVRAAQRRLVSPIEPPPSQPRGAGMGAGGSTATGLRRVRTMAASCGGWGAGRPPGNSEPRSRVIVVATYPLEPESDALHLLPSGLPLYLPRDDRGREVSDVSA